MTNIKVAMANTTGMHFLGYFCQRWLVKDVGGLYFSALNIGLSKRDLFRFMKAYSGKSLHLTLSQDEVFWRKVKSRALSTANR